MINRSMTVADYKRATIQGDISESQQIQPSNMATTESTPAPMQTDAAPAPTESATPATESQAPASTETPAAPDFSTIFETTCNSLPDDQRKVLVDGHLKLYKELETLQAELDQVKTKGNEESKQHIAKLQAELDAAKQKNGSMEKMYEDNIKATVAMIKNFLDQDGNNPNVTGAAPLNPNYDNIESSFREHPEMARNVLPIISCALNRNESLQSQLRAHQQESTRSAEERELFQRMRGFQRDSAAPTYGKYGNYTG